MLQPGELSPSAHDAASQPAVLCVDDDPNVLNGFGRQINKRFRIQTAVGARAALEIIEKRGPFGVVVSDLQMPGMDGIQFLTRVRAISPFTVRVMLTGKADISTAMAAVNQGNIFRFLVKPCPPLVFEKVLDAGIEQHKLLIAEQQLTQETLLGCVQVLVEVLSMVQPEAFSRAMRIRRHVRQIAAAMGLSADLWQLEAAAMLSQIGWITLRPQILDKACNNEAMSPEEQTAFLGHASAAARILEKIPRLGPVAAMIESQHGLLSEWPADSSEATVTGAHVLRTAIDFERLCKKGVPPWVALEQMAQDRTAYRHDILDAIAGIEEKSRAAEICALPQSMLEPGMNRQEFR